MRFALLAAVALLALPACETFQDLPTQSTGLPKPSVTLTSTVVRREFVLLVWSVTGGEGRRFEILRQNKLEPWKHFSTDSPVNGQIELEDTAVVPGQSYTYRIRLFGGTGDTFLDEIQVVIPA